MKTSLLFLVSCFLLFSSCGDDETTVVIINLNPCDESIDLSSKDAADAAAAIDLCMDAGASADSWGIVSARFSRASGGAVIPSSQFAIHENFGVAITPRLGDRMIVLSNGSALTPLQAGYCGTSCSGYGAGTAPSGYPQDVDGCQTGADISDDIAFEITIKAPATARGFTFDFVFLTHDNAIACTAFNDHFVAILTPQPALSQNGNISTMDNGDPISVNSSFVSADAAFLAGSGFETGASTGWLRTSSGVTPGEEFTLRFIVWDTGDDALNSTVVIDNFRWTKTATEISTVKL